MQKKDFLDLKKKYFSTSSTLFADSNPLDNQQENPKQGSIVETTTQGEQSEQSNTNHSNAEINSQDKRIERISDIVNSKLIDLDNKINKTDEDLNNLIDEHVGLLSDETSEKLYDIAQKHAKLRDVLEDAENKPGANLDQITRASRELDINKFSDEIHTLLQDDKLWIQLEQQLQDMKKDVDTLKNDNKISNEHLKHYNDEVKEFKENKNESIIDDFADFSTEMPSYTDPED